MIQLDLQGHPMTIKQASEMLTTLLEMQYKGGKYYKDIANIMNSEATTYNCKKAAKLLYQLKGAAYETTTPL